MSVLPIERGCPAPPALLLEVEAPDQRSMSPQQAPLGHGPATAVPTATSTTNGSVGYSEWPSADLPTEGEHCCPRPSSGDRSKNGSKDAVGCGQTSCTKWDAMDDRPWLGWTP
jgi:hypothetical protein